MKLSTCLLRIFSIVFPGLLELGSHRALAEVDPPFLKKIPGSSSATAFFESLASLARGRQLVGCVKKFYILLFPLFSLSPALCTQFNPFETDIEGRNTLPPEEPFEEEARPQKIKPILPKKPPQKKTKLQDPNMPPAKELLDEKEKPQDTKEETSKILPPEEPPEEAKAQDTNGVVLGGLDKVTGRIFRIEASLNQQIQFGTLTIFVTRCWRSSSEEEPENKAFLTVTDAQKRHHPQKVFRGWMLSSSPALSAMDHPVYDIWMKECIMRGQESEVRDQKAEKKN